jgi:hypothetical protein
MAAVFTNPLEVAETRMQSVAYKQWSDRCVSWYHSVVAVVVVVAVVDDDDADAESDPSPLS